MAAIVIFGGSGYIGGHVAESWLKKGLADEVILADIKPSPLLDPALGGAPRAGLRYVYCDVRLPIPHDLTTTPPAWIFNLAAVHREPGHEAAEYFETNIKGAENVTDYAKRVGCLNIFFTSSISVYGPTTGPTAEGSPKQPNSPYGASKYPAELVHQCWLAGDSERRLMIVRPGVVYGPRDPGNIGRMVRAIRKGYFAFPGSTDIYKSYAYIYGLLDSMDFVIASKERSVTYNYVENPTETLGDIARHVQKFSNTPGYIFSLPRWLLMPMAHVAQFIFGSRNPIHPVRVRKASMATHIIPEKLVEMGFVFKFSFTSSLCHWQNEVPTDWS